MKRPQTRLSLSVALVCALLTLHCDDSAPIVARASGTAQDVDAGAGRDAITEDSHEGGEGGTDGGGAGARPDVVDEPDSGSPQSADIDDPPERVRVEVEVLGSGVLTSAAGECADRCAWTLERGARLEFEASPADGYSVAAWTGACEGSLGSCAIDVVEDLQVGVRFYPDRVWTRHFGGTGYDTVIAVAPAPDGGAVLLGRYNGDHTFGEETLETPRERSAFLASVGPAGSLQWVQDITSDSNQFAALDLSVGSDGRIVVTLSSHRPVFIGEQALEVGELKSIVLVAFEADGELAWHTHEVGSEGLADINAAGDVGFVTFSTTKNLRVARLSWGGDSVMVNDTHHIKKGIRSALDAVLIEDTGGIIVGGSCQSFDLGEGHVVGTTDQDGFVAAFDGEDGDTRWHVHLGGRDRANASDRVQDLSISDTGELVVLANFDYSTRVGGVEVGEDNIARKTLLAWVGRDDGAVNDVLLLSALNTNLDPIIIDTAALPAVVAVTAPSSVDEFIEGGGAPGNQHFLVSVSREALDLTPFPPLTSDADVQGISFIPSRALNDTLFLAHTFRGTARLDGQTFESFGSKDILLMKVTLSDLLP